MKAKQELQGEDGASARRARHMESRIDLMLDDE